MTRALFGLAVLLTFAATAGAQSFDVNGYVSASAINASGPASWLDDGFGRFDAGGGDTTAYHVDALAGIDWTPVPWLAVHASGLARREPDGFGGKRAGLVDAYVDLRGTFGSEQLQLRAGQFFLPTSRENKGELWTSPYAISFSALNNWIGQEFRPIGADLEWRHTFAGGINSFTVGATAFRGNDTMGTLLTWRGWTIGNRLTVYDEVLPFPPHPAIERWFPAQRDDGTKPFGQDLDGENGYSARARISFPERAMIQIAVVDNPGDRWLHAGEYAWETNFSIISAEAGRTDGTVVAAEYLTGETGMGVRGTPWVQADIFAAYALVSQKSGRNRFTGRYDWFSTDERDFSLGGDDTDEGRAWTLAWLYDLTPASRLAVEFTQTDAERPILERINLPRENDGRAVTMELRYTF